MTAQAMLLRLRGGFVGNVATLMSGSTVAQFAPLLVAPLLTRIYSPSDFGAFALFMAIFTILSVVVAGRYELTVMLPAEDSEARHLVRLVLLVSALVSAFILLVVAVLTHSGGRVHAALALEPWAWFLPLGTLSLGVFQAMNFWLNRRRAYRSIAVGRSVQGICTASSQWAFGLLALGHGLVAGFVVGQLVGAIVMVALARRSLLEEHVRTRAADLRRLAREYRRFPLLQSWGALCDAGALQMPVLMVAAFFSQDVVGKVSLTFRVLLIPITLVAASVSQVLYQQISALSVSAPGRLHARLLRMLGVLALPCVPFVALSIAFGEPVFGWVFGPEWADAGRYAGIAVFAIVARFCVAPLSSVMLIGDNLRILLLWQAFRLATLGTTLALAGGLSIEGFVMAFAAHEVVQYALFLCLILAGARRLAR